MFESVKDIYRRLVFWFNFFKSAFANEEILFIDALYTKGVEAYAFGVKDDGLFVASKHYRMGWADFELYEKKVKPDHFNRKTLRKDYVQGVAIAYVYGEALYEQIAQDILAGKRLEHIRSGSDSEFFEGTSPDLQAGFKNATVVMNKQIELLKTDPTAKRIKEIHNGERKFTSDHPSLPKPSFVEAKEIDDDAVFIGSK